ncbi:hypothetical protein PoB_000234500 [Plakobranchus ocellatus]|uniref:Uncharacterized protein n=1 Tax=Plakobranchus ocellatus TaxID=259542 RepID=A0AAV3XYX2_9GAST|nr:hypothetical protein PoB_000234500 [Plakobranchus ocellatus]
MIKYVTRTGETSVKEAVDRKADFKLTGQVENADLIAQEAWYDEPFRKVYTCREGRRSHASTSRHRPDEGKVEGEERKNVQTAEEEAHTKGFPACLSVFGRTRYWKDTRC